MLLCAIGYSRRLTQTDLPFFRQSFILYICGLSVSSMRLKIDIAFSFLFIFVFGFTSTAQQSIDKASFFAAMQLGDIKDIDAQLKIIEASSINDKNAYYGALLMKKAGLVSGVPDKLNLFKSGHKKLETSIKINNNNVELHFLRLMIQENAPRILGYKNDEQLDADMIKKNYTDLPKVVRQAITDYSRQSKILKPTDFNFAKNE
jgi:hypothetical protein